MKFSEAFPSDYLRASDLQGRDVTVTIERVEFKELAGEHKPVLYFQNKQAGLVLNKTNGVTIVDSYGDDMNEWTGKSITLFPTKVDFQGRRVDAIRVRVQCQSASEPIEVPSSPPSDSNGQGMDDGIPF
jgi:hypothetical protein